MVKRTYREQGSILLIVTVIIVIAIIGVLGYIGYNTLIGQKEGTTVVKTANGGQITVKKSLSTPEAFGIKIGMTKTEAENAVGLPPSTTPCAEFTGSSAKDLGYDEYCSYGDADAIKNSNFIEIQYKDEKVVGAIKSENGGQKMTFLNVNGVTTTGK